MGQATEKTVLDRQFDVARAAWLLAIDLAAQSVGVDVRAAVKTRGTNGRGGTDATSRARRIAYYLVTTVANVRASELARAVGMDHTTVRDGLIRLADEQDRDPRLTATLEELEHRLIHQCAMICIRRLAHLNGEGA